MTDEKQKTGAKILNMLQNLTDKIDILSNLYSRMYDELAAIERRLDRLEEDTQRTKDAAERAEYEVKDLTKEVDKIVEQMPDLQTIVQDMERRERAYMHQTPAF